VPVIVCQRAVVSERESSSCVSVERILCEHDEIVVIPAEV
jgi:hypothetical protein